MSLRIGLTGGIGSGKSTVAALWVECGATLVDTDAIARQLTSANGPALPALERAFGPALIDPSGALDRQAMRQLVFRDAGAKAGLEAILHPLIGTETERQAAQALSQGAAAIVFDVPLLVESGRWRTRVDKVLVVDCPEQAQIDRVMQRSGWTADAVRAVIAQQASRIQRRAAADAVIYNHTLSSAALRAEVQALWRGWSPFPA